MAALRYCIEALRRAPDELLLHKRFLGAAFHARCQHGLNDRKLANALWEAWAQAYAPAMSKEDASEDFLRRHADPYIRNFFLPLASPDREINERLLRQLDTVCDEEGVQSHEHAETYESVDGNHLVVALFEQFLTTALAPEDMDGLEFGVGTGLLGGYLNPPRRLVGLDLSADMLSRAEGKGYQGLLQADITVPTTYGAFDFVASVGTILYFFDLRPVLRNALLNLRPGGSFVFSVVACSDQAYRMQISGLKRAHSRQYLEDSARDAGFYVANIEVANQLGPGFNVHLRKLT